MQRHGENNDIIIKDLTKTKKVKIDHIAVQQLEATLIIEVLSEKIIFGGSNLNLCTALIHDRTVYCESLFTLNNKINK